MAPVDEEQDEPRDISKEINNHAPTDEKVFYSAADRGFIGQNGYLYCASEGLATFVRTLIDRPALAKAMRLRADQSVTTAIDIRGCIVSMQAPLISRAFYSFLDKHYGMSFMMVENFENLMASCERRGDRGHRNRCSPQ